MANEVKTPIPARLYNAAVGGHVAGTEDIYDDTKGKTQKQINTEVEQSLGSGGSVDSRIQSAVNNEKSRAEGVESSQAERITTLENAVGSGGSVDERIATEGAKHYLKSETYTKDEVHGLITTPNQQYITVTATNQTTAVTDVLPASGEADTVYRVGNWDGSAYDDTVYSEYAWNGTAYVFLRKKDYGIDDEPTAGSDNLVKSGGVYDYIVDQFTMDGKGSTLVVKELVLVKNHRYKLIVHNPNFVCTSSSDYKKFMIRRYTDAINYTNLVEVYSPDGVIAPFYYIVNNVEGAIYKVCTRIDDGYDCRFSLLDVTNYEKVVFDINAHLDNYAIYLTLSEAVALIPDEAKEGNMTIAFVDRNGMYVEYTLMQNVNFTTDTSKWIRTDYKLFHFDASYNNGDTALLLTLDEAIARIPNTGKGNPKFLSFWDSDKIRRLYAYANGYYVPINEQNIVKLDYLGSIDEVQGVSRDIRYYAPYSGNVNRRTSGGVIQKYGNLNDDMVGIHNNRLVTMDNDGKFAITALDYKDIIYCGGFANYAFNFNGLEVGDSAPQTSESTYYFKSAIVPCSEGEVYCLSGSTTPTINLISTYPLYAFVDADNKIIYKHNTRNELRRFVTVPQGAVKMYVHFNAVTGANEIPPALFKVKRAVDENLERDKQIAKYLNYKKVADEYKKARFGLSVDWNTWTIDVTKVTGDNSGFDTYIIPCSAGQVFKIIGSGGQNCLLYSFIDENGQILEANKIPDNSEMYIVTTNILIAPENVVYLVSNVRYNYEYSLFFAESTTEEAIDINAITKRKGLELLDDARARLLEHNANAELINFAHVTDTHITGTHQLYELNAVYNMELFKEFVNENIADFAVHTGDIYTSYLASRSEAVGFIDDFIRGIGNTKCDVFYAKGNHDCNPKSRVKADMDNLDWEHNTYYILGSTPNKFIAISEQDWDGETQLYTSEYDNAERITRHQWYLLTQNRLDVVHNENDLYGGYFYKDIKGIRVIVLNVYDTDVLEVVSMTSTQRTWLSNVALNTDKPVIIFSHDNESHIESILGTFITNGGTLIAHIKGHLHEDRSEVVNVDASHSYHRITVANGFGLVSEIASDPVKAFCFSIFSVDLQNSKLYMTRIGRGSDAVYSF